MFLLVASLSISAQNTPDPDERLLAKYSQDELNQMIKSNPDEIRYLNFCADNAFYIAEFPKEKSEDKNVGSISIKDVDNFNFFELGVEIIDNNYSFLKIEGTDKMLVVRSRKHILENLNKK